MKNEILKSVIPLVAVTLSIVGAFAFKNAPEKVEDGLHFGATKIAGVCSITEVQCTDEESDNPCFDGSEQLWKMNNVTSCPNQLYRVD